MEDEAPDAKRLSSMVSSTLSSGVGRRLAPSFGRHLRLLLGQKWTLKKRDWKGTCCGLILPVCILAALLLISGLSDEEHVAADNYSKIQIYNWAGVPEAEARTRALAQSAYSSEAEPKAVPPFEMVAEGVCPMFKIALAAATGADVTPLLNFLQQQSFWANCSNAANAAHGGKEVFPTEDDAVEWAKGDGADKLLALLVVNNIDTATHKYDFSIRMNNSLIPQTAQVFEPFVMGRAYAYNTYLRSGFLSLQLMLDHFVACQLGNTTVCQTAPLLLTAMQVPYPVLDYNKNPFYDQAGDFMALIFSLAFIYPFMKLVKGIVEEKELRLKEGMLMMGLNPASYPWAWTISANLELIVGTLIAMIPVSALFTHTDKILLYALLVLFAWAQIGVCFFLASVFAKARTASLFSAMFLFVTVVPIFFVTEDAVSQGVQILVSILPSMAFGYCINRVAKFEGTNQGATWTNLGSGQYPVRDGIIMLIFDMFFFHFIAWYIGHVFPGEYGVPKKPWFCLTPSFWCPGSGAEPREMKERRPPLENQNELMEVAPPELASNSRVQVRGLRKTFGTFVAVSDLSMDVFEGQITVLLGHNGAGKTTSINMMTGMLPPSNGDCWIYGNSIRRQLQRVRNDLGVCPQHNILWANYTVAEHLRFFCRLKGVPEDEVAEAVTEMISAVNLPDKTNTWSMGLSGGMKRRLSVGIALIGGSRLVFLDEPTAGMDPEAREQTHTLLTSNTQGRVILLTTHFMDEADKLGDRIAIMSKGKLQCCGSPLFLKSRLGVGYNLTIATQKGANMEPIKDVVTRHVPQGQVRQSTGMEIDFLLPMECVKLFAGLFRELEDGQKELMIDAFGMSMTKLEDIFVKIFDQGEQEDEPEPDSDDDDMPQGNTDKSALLAGGEKDATYSATVPVEEGGAFDQRLDQLMLVSGFELLLRQFGALVIKRFHCARRDRKFIFCLVVLPVLVIIAALALTFIQIVQKDLPMTPIQFVHPEEPNTYTLVGEYPESRGPSFFDTSEFGEHVKYTDMFNPSGQTSLNVTNVLFKEYNDHATTGRYGGVVLSDTIAELCCYTNGQYDPDGAIVPVTIDSVMHNTTGRHSLPVYLAQLSKGKLRNAVPDSKVNITHHNHPLPRSQRDEAMIQSFKLVGAAIIILFPFTFIPANFAAFLVKERTCKAKHVQLVSGVNIVIYWISNYAWDLSLYLITVILSMLTFAAFGKEEYIGSVEKAAGTALLLVLYGMAATSMAYVLQFLFKNHSTAQNILMMGNLVFGVFLVIAAQIMRMIESTQEVNKTLMYFYRIVPAYCLGEGLLNMSTIKLIEILGGRTVSTFDMDVLGRALIYLAVEGPAFFLLTLFIEMGFVSFFTKRIQRLTLNVESPNPGVEDDDVTREREVEQAPRPDDLVTVQRLRKVYPPVGGAGAKIAVHDLSFGVHRNEIFALLGTNGAGKTTTLSILSGEFPATSGQGFLSGFNIDTQMRQARRNLGYCPQFDALLDLMTVKEHLTFYAKVRGIRWRQIPDLVRNTLVHLGLWEYRHKQSRKLSGGNKRKLSMGLAIIGGPNVVFLDEPSAGMDPMARRSMCEAIMSCSRGRSVILTTHHLEEVEQLANRVGIMVGGRFRCLGTLQHLKTKFGEGYWLEFSMINERKPDVIKFVSQNFGESTVEEQQPGFLRIKVYDTKLRLSLVFEAIEANRKELGIDDYSVSQPNLEQVFLNISNLKEELETLTSHVSQRHD